MRGRTIILTVLGVLAFVAMLGLVGTIDLQEEIIYSQKQVINYYEEVIDLHVDCEVYDSLQYTDEYINVVDNYYENYGNY